MKITYQFSKGGFFSGVSVEAERIGPKEYREIREAVDRVVAAEEKFDADNNPASHA